MTEPKESRPAGNGAANGKLGPASSPSVADEATRLAARGITVVPIVPGTRKPCIRWGPLNREDPAKVRSEFIRRPDTVARWWTKYPRAWLGIITGPSDLVVIDVDAKRGATVPEDLPATLSASTPSGGWHLYYRGRARNRNDWRPGIDVRGAGGLVIAPPSPGREWLGDVEPVQAPAWLIDDIGGPPARVSEVDVTGLDLLPDDTITRYGRSALVGELARLEAAKPGERNDTLNRAAFALGQLAARRQISRDVLESELRSKARETGLPDSEIGPTIASGFESGLRTPRYETRRERETRETLGTEPEPEPEPETVTGVTGAPVDTQTALTGGVSETAVPSVPDARSNEVVAVYHQGHSVRWGDPSAGEDSRLLYLVNSEDSEQGQQCCSGDRLCDHVWCERCGQWMNDTGAGPSCHPGELGTVPA